MKSLSTFINEELITVTKKYNINASVETFENSDVVVWWTPYIIDNSTYKNRQDFQQALNTYKELKMEGVKEVEIGFIIRIDDPIASTKDKTTVCVYVLNVYNNGSLKRTEMYTKEYLGSQIDEDVEAKVIKSLKQQYESITGLKTKFTSKHLSSYKL